MNTNRLKFMNVNIDSLTAQEAVNVIDTFVQERTPRYVVTPNSDIVVKMQKDNELLDSCNNADWILTDGEIVVKLASFLGKTIKEREPMTDFVWDVLNLAEDKGYKVCLFGGREDVLKKGTERIRGRYPSLNIVDSYSPKFGFEKDRRNFMMYCNKHFNFKYDKNLEHLPIGTEREYLYKNQKTIFVKYRNLPTDKNNHEMKVNWMRKTRYVFEKHYGTIPKGYNIIQLDGDYRNCDIDNLRCVSTKALRIINRYKAYGKTIITDALIKVLELDNDIKELIERRN